MLKYPMISLHINALANNLSNIHNNFLLYFELLIPTEMD